MQAFLAVLCGYLGEVFAWARTLSRRHGVMFRVGLYKGAPCAMLDMEGLLEAGRNPVALWVEFEWVIAPELRRAIAGWLCAEARGVRLSRERGGLCAVIARVALRGMRGLWVWMGAVDLESALAMACEYVPVAGPRVRAPP